MLCLRALYSTYLPLTTISSHATEALSGQTTAFVEGQIQDTLEPFMRPRPITDRRHHCLEKLGNDTTASQSSIGHTAENQAQRPLWATTLLLFATTFCTNAVDMQIMVRHFIAFLGGYFTLTLFDDIINKLFHLSTGNTE